MLCPEGSDEVLDGSGHLCSCQTGSCCRYRQEWSQLSPDQQLHYISAVQTVNSDPDLRAIYTRILELYQEAFDSVVLERNWEVSHFFPWIRYYLQLYEDFLRAIDSSITIPYWDWTAYPNRPYDSPVFDAELGFGNSADNATSCVNSGPFREGEFSVPSSLGGGGGCIKRTYEENFSFYTRETMDNLLVLPPDSFGKFYQTLHLLIHLETRCFVGGTMCTDYASSDPLYLLLLARLDLVFDQWQSLQELVRYSNDFTSLEPVLKGRRFTASSYSSNTNLPYNTAVCYGPLPNIAHHSK